jgi:hypothetical protein
MKSSLSQKQKLFCQYYVSNAETAGNGVQAYALAYGYNLKEAGKYQSAKTNAYKLLQQEDITGYIDQLLEDAGLNDQYVAKQMAFLIRQNADLGIKRLAIADYLKFHHRIAPQRSTPTIYADTLAYLAKIEALKESIDPQLEAEAEKVFDEMEDIYVAH